MSSKTLKEKRLEGRNIIQAREPFHFYLTKHTPDFCLFSRVASSHCGRALVLGPAFGWIRFCRQSSSPGAAPPLVLQSSHVMTLGVSSILLFRLVVLKTSDWVGQVPPLRSQSCLLSAVRNPIHILFDTGDHFGLSILADLELCKRMFAYH